MQHLRTIKDVKISTDGKKVVSYDLEDAEFELPVMHPFGNRNAAENFVNDPSSWTNLQSSSAPYLPMVPEVVNEIMRQMNVNQKPPVRTEPL